MTSKVRGMSSSQTTGYMQVFPFYVISYCDSSLTDGKPYNNIYNEYLYLKYFGINSNSDSNYLHNNYYRNNKVVKALIDYARSNNVITDEDWDTLCNYKSPLVNVQQILQNGRINITFGISFYNAFVSSSKNTVYDVLSSYCGDNNSTVEDIFYRNILVKLIMEATFYEDKYNHNCQVTYSIYINNTEFQL